MRRPFGVAKSSVIIILVFVIGIRFQLEEIRLTKWHGLYGSVSRISRRFGNVFLAGASGSHFFKFKVFFFDNLWNEMANGGFGKSKFTNYRSLNFEGLNFE